VATFSLREAPPWLGPASRSLRAWWATEDALGVPPLRAGCSSSGRIGSGKAQAAGERPQASPTEDALGVPPLVPLPRAERPVAHSFSHDAPPPAALRSTRHRRGPCTTYVVLLSVLLPSSFPRNAVSAAAAVASAAAAAVASAAAARGPWRSSRPRPLLSPALCPLLAPSASALC